MQYRFFSIQANEEREGEEELNRFLRTVGVLTVDRQFVADGRDSFWSLCVEYLESPKMAASKRGRVDYKEVLSREEFALFSRLREVRKVLAERDGVPPYAVVTNEHLAQMVREKPETPSELRKIEGIGDAKAAKYGSELLAALAGEVGEADAPGG